MARLHRQKLDLLLTDRERRVDLQASLGISRGVVREMIRALEERGVVSVRHGRGATVEPLERWGVLDPVVVRALLSGPQGRWLLLRHCSVCLQAALASAPARRVDTGLQWS